MSILSLLVIVTNAWHWLNRCRRLSYSALVIGSRWSELVIAAGTVFNQLIVWSVDTPGNTCCRSPVLHRLQRHKVTVMSAQLHPFSDMKETRSQAIATIADRPALQHLLESRDVIRHVTIWFPVGHFLLVVLATKPLSLTVSEIFNSECDTMVGMTLIWPLNRGQGHSLWYQSISHIRLPIGSQ